MHHSRDSNSIKYTFRRRRSSRTHEGRANIGVWTHIWGVRLLNHCSVTLCARNACGFTIGSLTQTSRTVSMISSLTQTSAQWPTCVHLEYGLLLLLWTTTMVYYYGLLTTTGLLTTHIMDYYHELQPMDYYYGVGLTWD